MNMRKKLLLSPADLDRLRQHIQSPRFAAIWDRTRKTADRVAALGTVSFPEDTMEIWYVYRNRSIDLGMALLATGQERYARAAHAVLHELAGRDVDFWQGPHYPNRPRTQIVDGQETLVGELETAQLTMGVALLYDLAYEFLSPEDRALALQLLRQYAHPLLGASVRFQSKKWVMNHLCVISVAWLLALMLLDEPSRDADKALAVHALNLWVGNMESDGSYGEGYHYWAYPVNCLFFAMQALQNHAGAHLQREGRIARAFEWALYHQAGILTEKGYEKPIAAAVNFHDCPRFFQMEAPEALLFANLTGNPVAQWYIDHFLLADLSRPDESLHVYWHRADALLLALYRDEQRVLSPTDAGYAGARCFFDTGYQFLRSGFTMENDLVFAMESGGGTRSRSHEHYDRNSFLLYAGGELFLADPGHSCYRGQLHKAFDTQTKAHATWTLNGQNQHLDYLEMGMLATEARAYTSYHNVARPHQQLHPEISLMASDARRCYAPAWKQYDRRAFLVGGEYILLWDSVDVGDQTGMLTCPLNLNTRDGQMEIAQQGLAFLLTRPRSALSLQIAAAGDQMTVRREKGYLHDAYHIYPDMPVEGKAGSAERLVLETAAPRTECLMLLCPLHRDENAPAFTAVFANGEIRATIRFRGQVDHFTLSSGGAYYCRENGAEYCF